MANGVRQYHIGRARLSKALLDGFLLGEDGALTAAEERQHRSLFLPALDSAQDDCPWGRLTFRAELAGDAVLTVRAFASNDPEFLQDGALASIDALLLDPAAPVRRKARLFEAAGGETFVGSSDVLLYRHTGRYLWLWVELTGTGQARLDGFRVLVPGDNFYRTFPTLYQQDGDFFHRYLSVFSSIYSDLQDRIDRLHEYLDVDACPPEVLPILARWLGLELDGNFLDEDHLRRLLKRMPELLPAKGTRRAIELVVELFATGPAYLVERNLLDRNQLSGGGGLYGDTPYDFTLLLSQSSDDLLRARLQFLVDQFKPLRSRAHIVFLGDQGGLDAYSYLDLNAALLQIGSGRLDDGRAQAGMVRLSDEIIT